MSLSGNKKSPHEEVLRDFALSYPGAHEDFPWGHRALKVKNKVFLFLGVDDDRLHVSVKLPISHGTALMLPFAEPTGYGLGKSGWITATFKLDEQPPLEMLRQWIDESYRTVAPKTLVARLTSGGAEPAKVTARKTSARKAPARKTPVRKRS